MQTKYLDRVKALTEKKLLAVTGNRLFIEFLAEGEKTTKSGLIASVATKPSYSEADSARIAVVLAAGPGYEVEDTGEKADNPYAPGDHIIVNRMSVKTFGDFFGLADYKADSIGLTTADLVQGTISNIEEFEKVLKG